MLRYLKIQNLAVIDQAAIEVGAGFVCLTGESGAGKSVLIDALLLLGGGRAAADLVRTGCDKAVVEAEFELDEVSPERELLEGRQLFLRREVGSDGKSRAFVNGVMVPAGILGQYGDLAFEIHGQHGQQRLLKPAFHREVFDEHSGLRERVEEFERALDEFRGQFRNYWGLKDSEAERLKEIDFLQLQIGEIDEVKPGEADLDLDQRLKVARNGEMIRSSRERLATLLGRNLLPNLSEAEKLIDSLAEFLPELKPYLGEVSSLGTSLGELRSELNVWDPVEDADRLAELEARETALNRLFLKYGRDLEEVLAERKRLGERLAQLRGAGAGLEDTWTGLLRQYAALLELRQSLHRARQAGAATFARNVGAHLAELALPGAVFEVDIQWSEWPKNIEGLRELQLTAPVIQFLFSPNPGESARPLARVASGGELSRVLLALIAAFQRQTSRLLVFDEIDAGLGGETAHAVGRSLRQLGDLHQVLCVTHFAQVARHADQQIKLEKAVEGGRTFTRLVTCDFEARVSELARLMGGDAAAESLREHARALLALES